MTSSINNMHTQPTTLAPVSPSTSQLTTTLLTTNTASDSSSSHQSVKLNRLGWTSVVGSIVTLLTGGIIFAVGVFSLVSCNTLNHSLLDSSSGNGGDDCAEPWKTELIAGGVLMTIGLILAITSVLGSVGMISCYRMKKSAVDSMTFTPISYGSTTTTTTAPSTILYSKEQSRTSSQLQIGVPEYVISIDIDEKQSQAQSQPQTIISAA